MFSGFPDGLIPFFLDIRFHNSREFMDTNRDRYIRDVRTPFYEFIETLSPCMLEISRDMETRPAKCLSRINRDTRFSNDKSPYRDHLWLAFRQSAVDKDGQPFFWFEISPEDVSWGLGTWHENRGLMDEMRRRMLARPEEFERFLPLLKSRGYTLGGEEWKKIAVPESLPASLRPWYVKRGIYFKKQAVPMEIIYSRAVLDAVRDDFTALAPLYLLLRGCAEEAMEKMDEQGGIQ